MLKLLIVVESCFESVVVEAVDCCRLVLKLFNQLILLVQLKLLIVSTVYFV